MTRTSSLTLCLALAFAAVLSGISGAEPVGDYGKAWEQLRKLSGNWDAYKVGSEDRHTTVSYHVTGGEAVLFEEFLGNTPDGVRSMATAYHLDVEGLVATHYCGAGNQPRMRAAFYDSEKRLLRFDFWDITHLPDPKAYYTTNIELSFETDDTVELRFRGTRDGAKGDWSVYRLRRLTSRPYEGEKEGP